MNRKYGYQSKPVREEGRDPEEKFLVADRQHKKAGTILPRKSRSLAKQYLQKLWIPFQKETKVQKQSHKNVARTARSGEWETQKQEWILPGRLVCNLQSRSCGNLNQVHQTTLEPPPKTPDTKNKNKPSRSDRSSQYFFQMVKVLDHSYFRDKHTTVHIPTVLDTAADIWV